MGFRHRLFLHRKRKAVIGDEKASQIGDVLAKRQIAIYVQAGQRFVMIILFGKAFCLLIETHLILRRPPLEKISTVIKKRPLIVKAVRQFMPDDGPDAAEIDRIIRTGSKNGGWRMAAGKAISLMSWL